MLLFRFCLVVYYNFKKAINKMYVNKYYLKYIYFVRVTNFQNDYFSLCIYIINLT